MKKSRKLLAIILCAVFVLSSFVISSSAALSKDRYSVLVLDCSGSMSGNPIDELRKGATAFCNQVLNSNRGKNQIAIVAFESSSRVVCDFTNDLSVLNDAISNLDAGGGTYLSKGLRNATTILNSVSEDAIKNILVMCDGLPFDEYESYAIIRSIPLHWNVYGLYYCPDGEDAAAAEVMENVGRNGFYKVTDGDALTFSFIDNGTTITNKSVNQVVVRIACPVDVSVTLNNVVLDKGNTRTTFGKLDFEGANDEIKVLTLAYRNDYTVDIVGTGDGTMTYTMYYYCNDELLYKLEYPAVPITSSTRITAAVDIENSSITLDVDADNDGGIDKRISPQTSASGIWYKIRTFFLELFYKIKDFFQKVFHLNLHK